MSSEPESGSKNFIRSIVAEDLRSGKHAHVTTRFPPEPSGYLHIGHATTICLNFGIADENPGGVCHLRFDDTNPVNEDIRWLGFDWKDCLYFTSDYFSQLYNFALQLIEDGKAFVCDLSSDEIFERRGSLTEPGTPSPYRDRSREENLDLFRRM